MAIVNETFARTYFPDREIIGQRIQTVDDPEAAVVGVVRDHRIGTVGEAPASVVYYPYAQKPSELNVHVRTASSPDVLVTAVRRAIDEIEGSVPVGVQTLRAATSLELTMRRTGTWMMGLMGGVGLLLAAIGIYGVMAYAAASRTVEVGIRMALGASSRQIRREMLQQSMMTAAPGVAMGTVAALVMMPAFSTFLAGISAFDPTAFMGGAAVLLLIGLAASDIPARRAARPDPMRGAAATVVISSRSSTPRSVHPTVNGPTAALRAARRYEGAKNTNMPCRQDRFQKGMTSHRLPDLNIARRGCDVAPRQVRGIEWKCTGGVSCVACLRSSSRA